MVPVLTVSTERVIRFTATNFQGSDLGPNITLRFKSSGGDGSSTGTVVGAVVGSLVGGLFEAFPAKLTARINLLCFTAQR